MPEHPALFAVCITPSGAQVVDALGGPDRPLARNFRIHKFRSLGADLWPRAAVDRPVACLIELAASPEDASAEALLETEMVAERLDAHGVSVFLFTTSPVAPVAWFSSPAFRHYHLLALPALSPQTLQECEETIIGHLHFARFASGGEVQVYVSSAIKFLRSSQRLEQECFVLGAGDMSPVRAACFPRLLARHSCPDFHAMDVERLDCTIDDLLESPGIAFSQSLPHYLLGKALDALALLHDWSDLGIVTLGDFRRAARRSLREIIPASAYFRHFRHVDPQELDRVPFRIVHCDLKPANFLLRITEETRHKMERGSGEIGPADVPELKITDFDLCRYSQPDPGSSGSSQGPSFTGTFGYTAPELFLVSGNTSGSSARDERRIVPLVDFYALGTLLFELLTRMPLVPRDMLDMEDDAYYGRIRTFQDSTEFRSRLSKVENPADRALIAACTEFRQADREAALRRLLGVPAQSGDLVASDLRDYHRRGHGLPGH